MTRDVSGRKYTPVKLTERQLEARGVKRGFRITVPGGYYPFYITETFGGLLRVGNSTWECAYNLQCIERMNPGVYYGILHPYLKRNGYATT